MKSPVLLQALSATESLTIKRPLQQLLVVISIILSVVFLSACEPQDRSPGMWLSGELVDSKIQDWSFTDEFNEVFVETHPWYGIPFSVTVVMVNLDNAIFVPSIYAEQADFPGTKYWNGVIDANPDVVMKIGEKLYPRRAQLVTDKGEFERVYEAMAEKYPFWRQVKDGTVEQPFFVLIRMDDPQ